jgi:hypothetical protein
MHSAAYFRERADTCLQLSQLMSDPQAADELRWRAREYLLEAQKLDRRSEDPWPRRPKRSND